MVNSMWLTRSETVLIELCQSTDEGRDVEQFREAAERIDEQYKKGVLMEAEAEQLLADMSRAPLVKDYPFNEPSDWDGIQKSLSKDRLGERSLPPKAVLEDRVLGAWLGRCSGCLLGQPVEGWMRKRIIGLLQDTGNYPIRRYMSSDIPESVRNTYGVEDEGRVYGGKYINWINNVSGMPEDDDTNYTVLNLKTVEEYGRDFTSEEMAHSWMMNLAFMHACTAERVAYRNLVNRIEPPYSAEYFNPYREWIGAQIRADIFGYISPGKAGQAALMAWKDARISHTKNGMYGELFAAAMISRAAVCDDMREIIVCGLGEIPEKSRLHAAVSEVLSWYRAGLSAEEALNLVYERFDESKSHDWCHTIPNAMICSIALLWGDMDFAKTIGLSVSAGFDTDCNGATTGSIVGMAAGAKKLPTDWISPLNDSLVSGIDGYGRVSIAGLAQRTEALL